jgi:hypothetical protein
MITGRLYSTHVKKKETEEMLWQTDSAITAIVLCWPRSLLLYGPGRDKVEDMHLRVSLQ